MAGKTAKKPKLTKKMLSYLDKAEVRTIIMFGMNVAPEQAYQADTKWCIDHIYDNQLEFAESDLSDIPVKKFRNDGVFRYVRTLQQYLLGSSEAPTWPPEVTNGGIEPTQETPSMVAVKPALVVEAVENGAVEEEEQVDEPVEASTEAQEGIISERGKAVQAPRNIGSPVIEKVSFTKVKGLGKNSNSDTVVEDNTLKETVEALTSVLSDSIAGNKRFYSDTSSSIQQLDDQLNQVKNAVLFIINSAILPEGEIIDSLDKIPSPPYN